MKRFIWITGAALLGLWLLFLAEKKIKQRWIVEKTLKSEHWQQRNQQIKNTPPGKYKVVFLGNSLTELFFLDDYFADSTFLNCGIVGDFSEGLVNRIDNIAKLKPEKLFIDIGINDIIEKIALDDICTNYREVIKKMQAQSPDTKIYIQSNLPVIINRPSFLTDNKDVNNRILQQNENLKKIAKEFNLTYIDIHTAFIKHPNLNELFVPDGVHLTPIAYTIWKNTLMPYLY
ncbi:MAG TPA: GDSL-type esterase/lipase family protein [Bacteroidia bacterium]|nr:GDSL-type esterase/lipase family protein [Bacteroidia bacterium]